MMGKDEATVAAAAALRATGISVSEAVDRAEELVDELQKRGYVAFDGADGVAHHFIVPPRSKEQG